MLRVKINGAPYEFAAAGTILNALKTAGIEIPTLCHDPRLEPYGGCRLCVVEVDGFTRPPTACNTPLADGMCIRTHTEELESLRRTLLDLLTMEYPMEAAAKFPEKEFHRVLAQYGLTKNKRARSYHAPTDLSHPNFVFDPERCIRCYRCVRICDEVQGQFVWNVWNRGMHSSVRPRESKVLHNSACVSCGACVDTCPTGALEDRTMLDGKKVEQWTRTTCPYCGTGCEMLAGTHEGKLVQQWRRAEPAQLAFAYRVPAWSPGAGGAHQAILLPAASRNTGPAPSMGQESLTASWMRSMPPATLGSETSISQRSSSSPPVKAKV